MNKTPVMSSMSTQDLSTQIQYLDQAIQLYQQMTNEAKESLAQQNGQDLTLEKQLSDLQALQAEYVKNSRNLSNAQTVAARSQFLTNLGIQLLHDSNVKRGVVNSDLYTLRRIGYNDQITYKNLMMQIAYLKYVATILSLTVLALVGGAMKFMGYEVTMYTVFTILLIGIIVIIYSLVSHMDDDDNTVTEKIFYKPTDTQLAVAAESWNLCPTTDSHSYHPHDSTYHPASNPAISPRPTTSYSNTVVDPVVNQSYKQTSKRV